MQYRERVMRMASGGRVPTFRDVLAARRSVSRHLAPTPLLRSAGLSERLGADVWVKHENHLPTAAFKVRGGVHLASRLGDAERRRGLWTASTGNHAQSIAFGGRVAGVPVTVAMPENANPVKVEATRALGAEVVLVGRDFDEAREWVAERAAEKGGRFVGPTDWELIAGVGTYALEIVEALPDVEALVVPVGAGSGACGCLLVAKHVNPAIAVVGVQAKAAPTQQQTWKRGEPAPAPMETAAEGLATRVPFDNAHALLGHPERGLDDFLLVSDEEMEEAIVLLLEHTRNLAEHAGAASLAGALRMGEALRGRQVALVLSGANLGADVLGRILRERRGGGA